MNRAGEAFHLARLPFDEGPQAAADTLVARARAAGKTNAALVRENDEVTQRLRATVARLGAASDAADGAALIERLDRRLDELMAENRDLAADIEGERARLAALSQEHAAVADQLSARVEREAKFRRAKDLITAAEGDVLYTATNDVLLRLSGLAFESGDSELRDSQIPLLEKVKEIVRQYEGARIVVEGHTDAAGDANANQRLSERRAQAVVQYLRNALDLSAERIQAIGFGSERPVASNQSAEGRARNRRIDIVIMR
jgi:outer membrane protein OmpA-like peptidoglycan-associated protein